MGLINFCKNLKMTEGKYDGVFYTIVQSSEGKGFDALFTEVFSWLRRKTDFFSDKKKAEECIAKTGEVQAKLWAVDQEKDKSRRPKKRRLKPRQSNKLKSSISLFQNKSQ